MVIAELLVQHIGFIKQGTMESKQNCSHVLIMPHMAERENCTHVLIQVAVSSCHVKTNWPVHY